MPDVMPDVAEALRPHWRVLAAGGVVLILIGALWAGQAVAQVHVSQTSHASPDTWQEHARFSYEVPVLRASAMFANGTILGMGEPGYFSSVAPHVRVTFAWSLGGASEVAHTLSDLVLRVRSQAPDGRDFWTLTFPLANASGDVAPGSELQVTGLLDVERAREEVKDAVASLGAASDEKLDYQILARVQFRTTGGRALANSSTFAMPLDLAALPLYRLPGADTLAFDRDHGQPVMEIREQRAGLAGLLASPLPLGAVALGAGALVLAWRARKMDAALALIPDGAFAAEARKFTDWITPARGPLRAPAGANVVELESLSDLVDVAAEARSRVLLDERRRMFCVYAPQAWYTYAGHRVEVGGDEEMPRHPLAETRARATESRHEPPGRP